MNKPPSHLPDSKLFARHMLMIYPFYLAATWLVAAGPRITLERLLEANTLTIVGLLSDFFAGALLAWEHFHLRKASLKIRECLAYDSYLDAMFNSRNAAKPIENAKLLEEVGGQKKQNSAVRASAEEYQDTKYKLAIIGFIILGVSAILQISGSLVA